MEDAVGGPIRAGREKTQKLEMPLGSPKSCHLPLASTG
jgi:hypothetical protein